MHLINKAVICFKILLFFGIGPNPTHGIKLTQQRRGAMNNRRFNDFETGVDELNEVQDNTEVSLSKKLERRRRIEDLFEEKRLREELSEFDML